MNKKQKVLCSCKQIIANELISNISTAATKRWW